MFEPKRLLPHQIDNTIGIRPASPDRERYGSKLSEFVQILRHFDALHDKKVDGQRFGESLFNKYVFKHLQSFDLKDDGVVNGSIFNNPALARYADEINRTITQSYGIGDFATVDQYGSHLNTGGSRVNGPPIDPKYLYSSLPVDDDILRVLIPWINTVLGAGNAYIPGVNYGQDPSITHDFTTGERSRIIDRSARLTSGFGPRLSPGGIGSTDHKGIDIGIAQGTPLKAPFDGIVVSAGQKGGYGGLVIIKHGNGQETRYAHLSQINVSAGDRIKAGQVFALSGGTPGTPGAGNTTGAHLHFEYRKDGKALDPLKYGFGKFFGLTA